MSEVAPGFRCPVCDSRQANFARVLHDILNHSTTAPFPLVRCGGCGLLRLHPLPDVDTLAAAYPTDYAPYQRQGISGWVKSGLERRSVRKLRRYLAPPNAVLDVGCSTGALLLAVRAAGNACVTGVEPDVGAARNAQRHGLHVVVGLLEDAAFLEQQFNTVVMSHTLEHVRDPLATLREAARILRPGGALVLWLPNAESIEARTLGMRWIGYDAPRHLTTFGVTTLERALHVADFTVVDVRHECIGLEWAWAVRLWLRARWPSTERLLGPLHPLLVVACSPLAVASALLHRSGRIRVIANRG